MKELAPMIHDENNGLDYVLCGDYYIPAITIEPLEKQYIGRWGRLHEQFIKENKTALYNELFCNGKLNSYLAKVDEHAQKRYELVVEQIAEKSEITEELKRKNSLEWVHQMNNVRMIAEEIIMTEMIYC